MEFLKKIPKTKGALLTAGGAVLGWIATSTLGTLEEIERICLRNQTRIDVLEEDDAKWGTLAEQRRELIALTIEVEVCKRLLRMRRSEPSAATSPLDYEDDESEPPVNENAEIDVPEFRAMQESKFEKR